MVSYCICELSAEEACGVQTVYTGASYNTNFAPYMEFY